MAAPVPEHTWTTIQELFYIDHSSGSEELGGRNLRLAIHHFLLDKVLNDHVGDITDQGGNVARYTINAARTPPYVHQNDGPWSEFRQGAFIASDVGRTVQIANAPSAGNNGYFTITAIDGAGGTWCEYTNASLVAETLTDGSMSVLKGSFPTLPNGRTPWRVNYMSSDGHGVGTPGDLCDRWMDTADYESNTSGDRDWVVYENEITGAQLLFYMETNSSGEQWERCEIYLNPEGTIFPYTGGDRTGTRPVSTGDSFRYTDGQNNFGTENYVNREWFLTIQHSSDGEQTHFWGGRDGVSAYWALVHRIPDDIPAHGGDGIPWDGAQVLLGWLNYDLPNADNGTFDHGQRNDNESYNPIGYLDPNGAYAPAAGPHFVRPYWACEGYISSTSAQQMKHKDDSVGEYMFFPVSLYINSPPNSVGRVGRLADIFWTNPSQSFPLNDGATFGPSRDWVKIQDMVFPWNGTRYRLRDGD